MSEENNEATQAQPKSAAAVEPVSVEPKMTFFTRSGERIEEVYADTMDVTWTPYDVRVRFAQAIPVQYPAEPRRHEIEERVAVTLAWAEAKYLRDVLTDVIDRCEKVNGEIKPVTLPI